MPFVQAKCPECGGMLAVESDKNAASIKNRWASQHNWNEMINIINHFYFENISYGSTVPSDVQEEIQKHFQSKSGYKILKNNYKRRLKKEVLTNIK